MGGEQPVVLAATELKKQTNVTFHCTGWLISQIHSTAVAILLRLRPGDVRIMHLTAVVFSKLHPVYPNKSMNRSLFSLHGSIQRIDLG